MTLKQCYLPILSWNINGIFRRINGFRYNKLDDPEFWNVVKNEKIFALIETHHTSDETDKLEITGFKCFSLCRKKDTGVKYKASGWNLSATAFPKYPQVDLRT